MLGYGFGGVSGDVSPGDAAVLEILFIQIIRSGSGYTDQL